MVGVHPKGVLDTLALAHMLLFFVPKKHQQGMVSWVSLNHGGCPPLPPPFWRVEIPGLMSQSCGFDSRAARTPPAPCAQASPVAKARTRSRTRNSSLASPFKKRAPICSSQCVFVPLRDFPNGPWKCGRAGLRMRYFFGPVPTPFALNTSCGPKWQPTFSS